MSAQPQALAGTGIGAAVPRLEDERLLTGRGRYADDISAPGMAYAHVVRSPYAHARIRGIDTRAALQSPGVIAVLTGEDVARDKLANIPCSSFPRNAVGKSYCPAQPILAQGKVRHVGDRVAFIVAETLAQAKDASERLVVAYEPLRAATLADALLPGAPAVWDEAAGNLSFQLEFGDRGAVEEQFARAAHVTRLAIHFPRAAPNSMEPRSAIAFVDHNDCRFTLWCSTQSAFRVREIVSQVLGIAPQSFRVRAMDVGGAFGMKGQVYPEDVLVAWAAMKLDRPVKWTADRSESIASDMHGRHQITEAALALDASGRVLAFRTSVAIDVGAYLSQSAAVPPHNCGVSYPGTYHVPLIHASVRAVFTNSTQLGPYRGSAKPEASFMLECLMDNAAHEMGIDGIEFRRRNLIRPEDMPYQTPGGNIYDCGNFGQVLDKALALSDWHGFAARRRESERRGVRRGIGLAMHCQRAGTGSERMEVRVAADGSVALFVGTHSTGQGHETMFAQMVSEWLAVPLSEVRVFQGDTDQVLFGRGSFAQRTMSTGGSALKLAADDVVRKAKRLSAWIMEVAEADVAFERGVFRVAGTDRQVSWREVAQKSYAIAGIPPEFGIGLDGVGTHPGPNTYPNGCIVAEVEVDTETGTVRVDRLASVDDAGTVVNPLTLHGQLHGSVAQGLGETLLESVIYEKDSGQLLTGSFLDYAMPRADVMPEMLSELAPVPTKTNLLGTKGGSEAGNVGAPAAIINAILDALSPWGVRTLPLPATPEHVWRALSEAQSAAPHRIV
jgi:aerobic carbon-monoxide dehydrogenase large subunit